MSKQIIHFFKRHFVREDILLENPQLKSDSIECVKPKYFLCTVCGKPFKLEIENLYLAKETGAGGIANAIKGEYQATWEAFDCPVCGCQNKIKERIAGDFVKPGELADLQKKRYEERHPQVKKEEILAWKNITCPTACNMYVGDVIYRTSMVPAINPFIKSTDIIEAKAHDAFENIVSIGGEILIKDMTGIAKLRGGDILSKIMIIDDCPNVDTEHTYTGRGDTKAQAVMRAHNEYQKDAENRRVRDRDGDSLSMECILNHIKSVRGEVVYANSVVDIRGRCCMILVPHPTHNGQTLTYAGEGMSDEQALISAYNDLDIDF